ncbi:acyloxyacyl hydrolase [Paracoccaceae bacterium]|nr:acyloxyacyl hydrolase [Paracoccaceae bacterium]MDA9795724.1 acyloxyacyl hydrolase [Paracoccaceae bacterium]
MDGTFAVLTLLAGFADISISDCKPNCYAESQVPQRISISAGQVYYQLDQVDTEVYLRKQTGRAYGPWRMVYGASATQRRDYWAGVGVLYEAASKTAPIFAQLHLMSGLYARGAGEDLGGPAEFRSGIEVGYDFGSAGRLAVSYDHRSNAGIYATNFGLETVQLRYSWGL